MRKPSFCICENKDADQLRGNRIVQSLYFLNPEFIYGCTVQFMSDLIGNPEDRFSHNEAHIYVQGYFRGHVDISSIYINKASADPFVITDQATAKHQNRADFCFYHFFGSCSSFASFK